MVINRVLTCILCESGCWVLGFGPFDMGHVCSAGHMEDDLALSVTTFTMSEAVCVSLLLVVL